MKIYQVDAFTDQPFHGNPAAVCFLEAEKPEAWLLALAAEMNLSETAFLLNTAGDYRLRWFTPKKEVSLCGHATLATAHLLWSEGYLPPEAHLRFQTLSGELTARRAADWIELDFPARFVEPAAANPKLNHALGLEPVATSKKTQPQGDYYLLEAASEAQVRALTPNFEALNRLGLRAILVTSRATTPGYDFVSRYFAPLLGVNEDPVTGSAHCYLATYWGQKLSQTRFTGWQASARGGTVRCVWEQDRVLLQGQAVTVFRGDLQI